MTAGVSGPIAPVDVVGLVGEDGQKSEIDTTRNEIEN